MIKSAPGRLINEVLLLLVSCYQKQGHQVAANDSPWTVLGWIGSFYLGFCKKNITLSIYILFILKIFTHPADTFFIYIFF